MVEHQGPRRLAVCQILVNGNDITTKLFPYLISVQVTDNLEGGMDEANIELDDRNAELQIPPDGAELEVWLGWSGEGPRIPDLGRESAAGGQGVIRPTEQELKQEAPFGGPGLRQVFDGWVTNVESGFGRRGGGRRMWIEGKGFNDKGQAKEAQQAFLGEGKEDDSEQGDGKGKVPLKDMMTKVFGAAGLSVAMSPEMEKIARDYWHTNDSPMNFGKRIAAETGGFFKISKRTAILIGKTEGVNAAGEEMPTVEAVWGINLIGWRIKPYVARPQWGSAQSRFFDAHGGAWKDVKGAIGGGTPFGGSQAIAHAVNSVTDQASGEQTNTGASEDSKSRRGTGWVLLNGEPNAKANGFVTISGARPGVDGTYTMTLVEHNYTRGVGYTTRATVQQPRGTGAGMEWVQDGDTEEEKRKRDEAYAATGDPDALTPPFAGEPSTAHDANAPSPPISGDQTLTQDELDRIQQFPPRPGEPGAPDVPISDREPPVPPRPGEPGAPNVPISQSVLYLPGGVNPLR